MNIRYILTAIRTFGIRGIVDYILRKPKEYAFQRYLKSTLRTCPPERGITLIACFDFPGSLSKVMRDLALMLKRTGIPYQTLNRPCKKSIPISEMEYFMTPKEKFHINKYSHIITMRDPFQSPDKRCNVHCIEFWEFDDGFIEFCPETLIAKNILAFSDFNLKVFRKLLPVTINVRKLLYPFQFIHNELPPVDLTRQKYCIDPKDFTVFFNFDYDSSYFRKNPEGILLAFAKSLGSMENTKIIFKTMRAQKCKAMSDRLYAFAKKLGLDNKLITIDDFIPQEDLVALTNACDVYISLHRGEGFGLGIAEAMSLGKPVITTNYSASTEFCNTNNSIPISYEMVKVMPDEIDIEAYNDVTMWAEPDYNAAAEALLKLYNDPDLRISIGNAAKKFIDEYFSVENFKKSVDALLDDNHETLK